MGDLELDKIISVIWYVWQLYRGFNHFSDQRHLCLRVGLINLLLDLHTIKHTKEEI